MSWFNNEGACSSHIIWSRVRYIRNPSGIFYKSGDRQAIGELESKLSDLMLANGFRREDIPSGSPIKLRSLAEKQFIPYRLEDSDVRAVYFNEPCSLIISFGGRDLFDIRSLLSGKALPDALNIASQAEELLDGDFDFAYSDELGYLSPMPQSCGSGAEFSVALFLPSARYSRYREELELIAGGFGASLTPFLSDAENHGDIYILSYVHPLGADEGAEIVRFDSLAEKLVERELENERIIFAGESIITVERAYRAFGELIYARLLSESELLSLISSLRLAILLFPNETEALGVSLPSLDRILAECMSNSIIESLNKPCQSLEECDGQRASAVKAILKEAVEANT